MTQHYHSKGTADENIDNLDISTKQNDADFATAIDIQNENYISNEIKRLFPSHEIIGEETTGTGSVPPLTDAPTWIIGECTVDIFESRCTMYNDLISCRQEVYTYLMLKN